MLYGYKCQINYSHRSRGDTPDEESDDTSPSCKDSYVSNVEVDTWGVGDWDEQDIGLSCLRGVVGGTEIEPREGVDARDIIGGHSMMLLNNMRVETNGPNVNSRGWWGSTSTQGGVAGG